MWLDELHPAWEAQAEQKGSQWQCFAGNVSTTLAGCSSPLGLSETPRSICSSRAFADRQMAIYKTK